MAKLRNREQFGTMLACRHGGTVGTAWSDFGAQNLYSMDGAALTTGDVVSYAVVKNASTAAVLYVLARTGGTIDTARAFRLAAGASFSFDIYGIDNGVGAATISLRGSASPCTYDLTAWYIKS